MSDTIPAKVTVSWKAYADLANERDELRAAVKTMREAGSKLGHIAERICTTYEPTRKDLTELDDARMKWDAALTCAHKDMTGGES